ncbi:MAG: class I adenylate-forming enzyme family protein [Bacilli bacterium]
MKDITGYPSVDKTHEKGETFLKKHPFIPSISVFNAVKLINGMYKNDCAVSCMDLSLSYDEIINMSVTISKSFKELGVKENEVVSVLMPNLAQAVAVYLAANRIGATVSFLNTLSSMDEKKNYLNLFESKVLVNYDQSVDLSKKYLEGTKVKQVITLKKEDVNRKSFNEKTSGLTGYSDFINYSDMSSIAAYYRNPVKTNFGGNYDSLILFTSGSTGKEKAVVITNKNIVAWGTYEKNSSNLSSTRGEKSIICVPFSYPYGFITGAVMCLMGHKEAILAQNIGPDNIGNYLKKGASYFFGTPNLLATIRKSIPDDQDLSELTHFITGGDYLPLQKIYESEEFFKKHNSNARIYNGSGNAETCGGNTNAVGITLRPETVGKVLDGTSAIVVDDENHELKYNEEGMLCIHGKHVFKEYFNEPGLSKNSKFIHTDGKEYFKTGTTGFLDETGYFHLTGRPRFFVDSNLNKVYCSTIQNFLSVIDIIDSVAVVKKPQDDIYYTSVAYIVLKEGVLPTEETINYIKKKCSEQLVMPFTSEKLLLKPYEMPAFIEFVTKIPQIKAGKVDYLTLEKKAEESYELELSEGRRLEKKEIQE